MRLRIDKKLVVNKMEVNGTIIYEFSDDAKQCKGCLSIKNKRTFNKNYKFKDGLNIYCSRCLKDKAMEKKIEKLRKETELVISKVRVSVEADTMDKIRKVAMLTEDIIVLRTIKKEVEKIYFNQQVNDEMIENLIERD